jgi:DNA-binding transcriptional ArsR family regulator
MTSTPTFAATAALFGHPVRAAILSVLLDGRALPAGELAYAGGVNPATASSHLGKLLDGGILAVEVEGRHRYYRLAGPHIAEAIESLLAVTPIGTLRRKAPSREARRLQRARRCYDHLAGRLGVAVTAALVDRGIIVPVANKQYEISPTGAEWFAELGIDIGSLRHSSRGLARQCLDWTEREHHLAGPLGVALLGLMCEKGWVSCSKRDRALQLTPSGQIALSEHMGIEIATLR